MVKQSNETILENIGSVSYANSEKIKTVAVNFFYDKSQYPYICKAKSYLLTSYGNKKIYSNEVRCGYKR